MDVELPDGTVIEGVPEGTTKSQLMAKLRAGGYDVSKLSPSPFEARGESVLPTPVGMTEQYGPASEALAGLLDVGTLMGTGGAMAARQYLKEPVKPLVDVAKGAVGLPIMAGQAAMGDEAAQAQLFGLPGAIMQNYAEAYGSPRAAYMTAATEPGRFVTDIAGIPSMAGMATGPGRAAANVLAEVAYPRVRRAMDPMNRMLADVYNEPEIQAALQEAPAGMTVPQALADVNAPVAQAVTREAAKYAPEQTRAAQLAQEQARLEQISKIARTPEELAAAEEARGAAATENYRQAFRAVAPDLPEEFLEKPSMKVAFREADKIAAERGGEATPVEQMHNIKLALDKIVSKPEDYKLGGAQKAAIAKTREEFIDRLKTVPEYARARAEFASQSVPISQMQVAQELKNILLDPTTEAATRGGMFTRAMKDVPKVAKRATGQSYYENLSDLFPSEQVEVFEGIADDFRRNKLADEQAALGAATAPEVKELASANISSALNIPFLNRTWTIANTAIKRSLGQIDEKLAVKLALLVQDPKELSRAIAKAKRWEKETAEKVKGFRAAREKARITPQKALLGGVPVANALSPQTNQNAMAR